MKTTIEFIKLTLATVGTTILLMFALGIATVEAKDLYKSNLGVSNLSNDTTIKGFSNNWWTTGEKYLKRYEKKKGITLFDLQSDVTRYGDTAFFIQAPGDECFQRPDDCKRLNGEEQKRVEAKHKESFKGMVWVSYSFMMPDTYELNGSRKAILQFHSDYDYFGPMFLLQLEEDGLLWTHESAGGHIKVPDGRVNCSAGSDKENTHKRQWCEARMDTYQLIPGEQLERNVWYDVVFNINFDNKKLDKAFHKIWINGELVHERHNQTLWLEHKGLPSQFIKATFNFGIYGTSLDKSYQALYVDEVHFARKCNKLLLENIGYECGQIESQEIVESIPYMVDDRAAYHLGQ